MRRAITSTLLTRLHQSLGPLGASSAAAGAAANSLPLLSAASETSRAASSSSSTAGPLVGVCVLERLPVITPPPPAWKADYGAWQAGVHEGRAKVLPDELVGGGGRGGKGGGGAAATLSSSGGGAAAWAPAPRITPADESGDTASLRRALDKRLFMLLGGASPTPTFPAALHSSAEGEPIRAAAERALASAIVPGPGSPPLETYFVGNAPAGHLDAASAGGVGGPAAVDGTLFFHRAQLIAGDPAPTSLADGPLAWLTKEELVDKVGPGPLADLVRRML